MKIVDPTLRRELAGPCKVSWQEGIRKILATRFPGSVVSAD